MVANSFKVRPPAISTGEKVERMGLCEIDFAGLEAGNGVSVGWLLFFLGKPRGQDKCSG